MFSLHFNVSMSLFEFVPLELTVEISVTDDPKFQDQISRLLLYGGDRLGKSPDMVNLLLSLSGFFFISRMFKRAAYFFKRRFWNHFSIKN